MAREIIHIHVKAEVKAEIARLAAADGRSMANYIERILEKHILEGQGAGNKGVQTPI